MYTFSEALGERVELAVVIMTNMSALAGIVGLREAELILVVMFPETPIIPITEFDIVHSLARMLVVSMFCVHLWSPPSKRL